MTHLAESAAHLAQTGRLELIGHVVRLQVQTSSLKCGEKPHRWYNPEFIRPVPALRLDSGGATGLDRGEIADVHHRDHPASKFRGENGVSVGFTAHYERMRSRFGPHLTDGIAGETILVESTREFPEHDIAAGIVIIGATRPIELAAVQHAPPCVEFSKFCAGYEVGDKPDAVITETLRFLHQGMRGFYATLAEPVSTPVNIAIGDAVYRRLS